MPTVRDYPQPGSQLLWLDGFRITFYPASREQFYRRLTYRIMDQGQLVKSGTLSVTFTMDEPNGKGCGPRAWATLTD